MSQTCYLSIALQYKEVTHHVERNMKMSNANTDQTHNDWNVEQWLRIRKEEGLLIEPATAEVTWVYAQTLDPYGVHSPLPEEYQQVGREYFARSPGENIWVWFGDL
jgi:hypothetical protein